MDWELNESEFYASQGSKSRSKKLVEVADIYHSTHKTCFSFLKIHSGALMFIKYLWKYNTITEM